MKIIFDRDIVKRKLRKGTEYLVLAKRNVNGRISYAILNDGKYPTIIELTNDKNTIIDSEFFFHQSHKINFKILEIESEIEPLLVDPFGLGSENFSSDLFSNRCWAVTKFSHQMMSIGVEVNEEYSQIAFQDTSKMIYVQAEMSALFLGVCNFFAGCVNMQYHFRFDKHNKNNIDLVTLANVSYNRHHNTAKDVTELDGIKDWKLELTDYLYSSLTIYSDFGRYIQENDLQENIEDDRGCLRSSIRRIVLALESIFYDKKVIIHKVPMKELSVSWPQYCLIFETSEFLYRFYIGNYD